MGEMLEKAMTLERSYSDGGGGGRMQTVEEQQEVTPGEEVQQTEAGADGFERRNGRSGRGRIKSSGSTI